MKQDSDLNLALDGYRRTARGQLQHIEPGKLAGYAAAVGAGLALSGTADATIIYSGVQNITLAFTNLSAAASTTYAGVDVDGVGGADFFVSGSFSGNQTWTSGYFSDGFWDMGGKKVGVFADPSFPYPMQRLASGQTISTGAGTLTSGGNFQARSIFTSSFGFGGPPSPGAFNTNPWAPGDTAIAGFRLSTGNFGWIRIALGADVGINNPAGRAGGLTGLADSLTIVDWAYEDSGATIRAGDTGVAAAPSPAPLALLAAGAFGIGAMRRRRQQAARA